jgi:hypothetical protein
MPSSGRLDPVRKRCSQLRLSHIDDRTSLIASRTATIHAGQNRVCLKTPNRAARRVGHLRDAPELGALLVSHALTELADQQSDSLLKLLADVAGFIFVIALLLIFDTCGEALLHF